MTGTCPCCGCSLDADRPLIAGPWSIDPRGVASFAGALVTKRRSWVNILHTLAKEPGRPISSSALADRVSDSGHESTLAAQVCYLRRHLAEMGVPNPIESTRGRGTFGYRWVAAA